MVRHIELVTLVEDCTVQGSEMPSVWCVVDRRIRLSQNSVFLFIFVEMQISTCNECIMYDMVELFHYHLLALSRCSRSYTLIFENQKTRSSCIRCIIDYFYQVRAIELLPESR